MGEKAPNLSAVRALVADAEAVPNARRFGGDPQPGEARGRVLPGQWRADALGLPPECPVVPLGVDGTVNWFLDPIGQLTAYVKPYGQADTLDLFRGRHLYLYWAWPKFSRTKVIDGGDDAAAVFAVEGWKNEKVRECMIAACTAKGPWSAVEKVRGRGAWLEPDGSLVLHCGRELMIGGERTPPGELMGCVYPTRPPVPRPWPQPLSETENPARLLRPVLRSWAWARPEVDPHLLLGWIGAAFLGGALAQRPTVYITGDKNTGKSTLQHLIKGLLGDWLIQATDTSAAGLYQHIGHDTLAVAVDEFEGKVDTRKATAVLELARQAYSGGLMLRGGDRHKGVEFRARSCFLFSSINTPPLRPQDLSRMAILRLYRLAEDAVEPDLDARDLGVLGRCILARLTKEWERFHYTFKAFRGELRRGGMDARGCDTFGTLLACADLIEHDGWDEARLKTPVDGDLKPWSELMAASAMVEFEDATENWLACLNYMLSVPVDAWRNGTRSTVGQVLEEWANPDGDYSNDVKMVRKVLAQAGLGLQRRGRGDDWLIVPNNNPALRKLFEGTIWAGEQGASVWAGALRQAPHGRVVESGQCTVAGVKSRCTLVSLTALYGPEGMMVSPSVNAPDPDPMMAEK